MAVTEFDGHVLEERLLTELNGDVGDGNHGRFLGVGAGNGAARTTGRRGTV
jgi:hypothetical protein